MLFRVKSKTPISHNSDDDKRKRPMDDHDDDIYELVESLSKSIKALEETFSKFIEVELKSMKEEINRRNKFLEEILLRMIEKPSDKKPSSVEAYIANKNSQASSDSKKARLPG